MLRVNGSTRRTSSATNPDFTLPLSMWKQVLQTSGFQVYTFTAKQLARLERRRSMVVGSSVQDPILAA